MLTAIWRCGLRRVFDIHEGEIVVGAVEYGALNRVTVGGTEYPIVWERTGWPNPQVTILLKGGSLKEEGSYTLATAESRGLSRRLFRLTHHGRELTLRFPKFLRLRYVHLMDGEAVIGTARMAGIRSIRADLPDDMPLGVRLFVVWLFLTFAWH